MSRGLPTSFYAFLFVVLLAANISLYRVVFAPDTLRVSALEVGKGGATLLRGPSGETILIDTGPDAGILRALGTALPVWQRKIDAVVLTSAKSASTGGMGDVSDRYLVSRFMHFGGSAAPYGSTVVFKDARIKIIAPSALIIFYGSSVFNISSSTPKGDYTLNGKTILKN